jgi:hypothetical protein
VFACGSDAGRAAETQIPRIARDDNFVSCADGRVARHHIVLRVLLVFLSALVVVRYSQNGGLVEVPAQDLQSNRQVLFRLSAGD